MLLKQTIMNLNIKIIAELSDRWTRPKYFSSSIQQSNHIYHPCPLLRRMQWEIPRISCGGKKCRNQFALRLIRSHWPIVIIVVQRGQAVHQLAFSNIKQSSKSLDLLVKNKQRWPQKSFADVCASDFHFKQWVSFFW